MGSLKQNFYNANHAFNFLWDYIKDNGVDFDNTKKDDGFIYWWDLTDYLKPTPYGYLSAKLYKQGDCKTFRYKFLRFYFYSKPMGKGAVQVEEPVEKGWQYPHPNSAQSLILKSVCNKSN